jgi:hypothetical protein
MDVFTLIGKQIANPVRSANYWLVKDFDEKMKQYVKANFRQSVYARARRRQNNYSADFLTKPERHARSNSAAASRRTVV